MAISFQFDNVRIGSGSLFLIAGPCVIVQDDSTACVPPGFGATVDGSGNIILEQAE